jgi:hypothetical protein
MGSNFNLMRGGKESVIRLWVAIRRNAPKRRGICSPPNSLHFVRYGKIPACPGNYSRGSDNRGTRHLKIKVGNFSSFSVD